jgi:two-component system, chemotaxis family, sensor kinase CheA
MPVKLSHRGAEKTGVGTGGKTMDPSSDAVTRFASTTEPLLGQLEQQWNCLRKSPSNLALLVSVLEQFGKLREMAASANDGIVVRISRGCEELLSGVLCDQFQNPQPALDIVEESLGTLRNHIARLVTGGTQSPEGTPEDEPACAALLEYLFQLLKVLLAHFHLFEVKGIASLETRMAQRPGAQTPAGVISIGSDEEQASRGVPAVMEGIEAYSEFAAECAEHLDSVEENLLALENNPHNASLLGGIFRRVHSIKGGAACFNLIGIERLSHDTETLLDGCRKGVLSPTSDVIALCLRSVDALKRLTQNLNEALQAFPHEAAHLEPVVYGPIRSEIRDILEQHPPTSSPETPRVPAAPPEPPPGPRLGDILVESGDITRDDLEHALSMQDLPLGEILVEMGRVTAERVERALARQREAGGSTNRTLRVETGKIDDLVGLVGKLARLEDQVFEKVGSALRATGEAKNAVLVEEGLAQLLGVTRELQERSKAFRMAPIQQLFGRMARVVREANRRMKRNAQLAITGGNVFLDRTAVEQMTDPLIHMVRNCLDHGIESAEERRSAGKPAEGTVTLDANPQEDRLVIRVSDDGRGLNRERLLEKGLELGLLRAEPQPTDAEIFDLIFVPGFTTARAVTDYSGRGVGMDVVKQNVEKLQGWIEVASRAGQGVAFIISLPLSLVMACSD